MNFLMRDGGLIKMHTYIDNTEFSDEIKAAIKSTIIIKGEDLNQTSN